MRREGIATYFSSMWNCLDICGFTALPISIIQKEYHYDYPGMQAVLGIIYAILFLRGMSYMRIFNNLRYLINMIIEILKDMRSFIIILVYWIIALTLIFRILKNVTDED